MQFAMIIGNKSVHKLLTVYTINLIYTISSHLEAT